MGKDGETFYNSPDFVDIQWTQIVDKVKTPIESVICMDLINSWSDVS